MRLGKPFFVLGQRGITGLSQAIAQSIMQMNQLVGHRRFLGPWRDHPRAGAALPGLDDIGHADAKSCSHRPRRKMVQRKNPITQILRICLTTTPTHRSLRHQSETYESHQIASLKEKMRFHPRRNRSKSNA